ncbi:MAG: helix-turn-helix transcriptional regulator [Bacteroidales bacterium]|nr:helix-turn-helix transcriptional regulator [Bacteroidales bacterium]
MIRKTPIFDWKEVFDKTKEECKVGYDFLTSNDINTLYHKGENRQTNYYIDIFLKKGELVFEIDAKEYHLDSPSSILIQPGNSFQILSFSSDLSINIFIVSKQVRDNFLDNFEASISLHNSIRLKCFSCLDEKDADILRRFVNELNEVIAETNNPFRLNIIKHLNTAYYYRYFYSLFFRLKSNNNNICDRFFQLLDENFVDKQNVEFYADSFSLSKGYFEVLIKNSTGRSFKSWIDERLITEAKRLLLENHNSIEYIAEFLGFNSQSNFSRFFKRMANLSPIEFRKGKNNEQS